MGAAFFCPQTCGTVLDCHTAEWLLCIDNEDGEFGESRSNSCARGAGASESSGKLRGGRRRQPARGGAPRTEVGEKRLEDLTNDLFNIHDLNRNGLLEEHELIALNERIAVLHHGKDFDTREVRATYRALFREKLDPAGRAVPYEVFRKYAREVLDSLDDDPEAQEMILEQFVAEAQSGAALLDMTSLAKEMSEPRGAEAADAHIMVTAADGTASGSKSPGAATVVIEDAAVPGLPGTRPELHHAVAAAAVRAAAEAAQGLAACTDADSDGSPGIGSSSLLGQLFIDDLEQRSMRCVGPRLPAPREAQALTACRAAAGPESPPGALQSATSMVC